MRVLRSIAATMLAVLVAATISEAQEPAPPAAPAEAQAAEAPPAPSRPWPPPFYADRRFEENWQPLDWNDPHKGARDIFDPIKAIKLNDSGSVWIGFGGQQRGRMARQSTVFYGGNGDFEPVMCTWRTRAYADLHLGEKFRVFGEGIYSYTTIDQFRLGSVLGIDRGGNQFGAPNLNGDMLNAFAEFSTPIAGNWRGGAWGGRRELQMGHERVISPGNWLLNRHTFDGAGAWIDNGRLKIEGFVTRPHIPVPDMFSRRDDDTVFSGLIFTTAIVDRPTAPPGSTAPAARETRINIQPYILHVQREDFTFVQHTADENRTTFGMLVYGDVGRTGFDFEYEGMYQYGRYNTGFDKGAIHAHSTTIELGYRLPRVPFMPRPIVSFNYASGDDDQTDARLGTFDPLYPLAYAFFGFHAAFDRKNFVTPGLHLDAVLRRNMFLRANYFPAFWRAETNDGVYNTFNQIVRRPEPQSRGRGFEDLQQASRNLGNQFDFGVAWLPSHHLLIYGTYLRFNAGQFFDDTQTAPRDNMNGVMILTQFTF
jgi:hypothetical protein